MVKTRLRTFYTLGVVLFILAAVVSYLLSRHILSPVDELTRGTDALAQFKFSTRIKVRTTDELGRLAADFNRMAQTLERFETMRRQWIVDISHELRTPLAVLKGEIEALLEGVRPTCPEQIRSLHAEVIHLEKIVNDLHMISSADTQALVLKKQAVDPFEIVSSVLHSFGSRLENAGLKIDILDNLPKIRVMADEIRLRQLFSNIIENNIKYTESPGLIRVNGDAGYQSVTIVIADTGPGVPEDCLEKIFDRLFRLDAARQRESGGTGLGLSICKTIARAHGGDIFASLSEAGGLGITLVLPLEES